MYSHTYTYTCMQESVQKSNIKFPDKIFVHAYTHTHVPSFIHVYTYSQGSKWKSDIKFPKTNICRIAGLDIYVSVCIRTPTCIHKSVHSYTCVYIHLSTHMHAYVHTLRSYAGNACIHTPTSCIHTPTYAHAHNSKLACQ
jgi:hypothetical protein